MREYNCTKCDHPMRPVLGEGPPETAKVVAHLCHKCFTPHLSDGTQATNEVLKHWVESQLNAEKLPKGKQLNAEQG